VLLAAAVAVAGLSADTASAAQLDADFHFNGTRSAPTGEAIADIGTGNAFESEIVDRGPGPRSVLAFPTGNGLSLPTAGLASSGSYSIAMLFRLDSISGRRKLLDFSDGTSGAGLYLCNGQLQIDLLGADLCVADPDSSAGWMQVVLTRDGESGSVHAFLDDGEQSLDDGGGALALPAALRLFIDDDGAPGDEQSGGAVARVRVYDGVMSPQDVVALDRVDAAAPVVSLDALPAITADSTPALSGAAGTEAGDLSEVSVAVYSGLEATGTPVRTVIATRSGGSWTATAPTLADGTYTAQAEQADGAGNTGRSAASTFTVDSAAPAVSVSSPAAGSATRDPTPAYSGGAGDGPGDGGTITLRVYSGPSATGSPVQTLSASRSGASWSVTGSAPLPDGVYTVRAAQSDAANNTGQSSAVTFAVDTTGPTPSVAAPAAGTRTNDATPHYAGGAGDAAGDGGSVAVRVYAGSGTAGAVVETLTAPRSGSSWAVDADSALADGVYTVVATQSDTAGNTGTSDPVVFAVDTAGAAVSISSPANGGSTNDTTPSYAGVAGDDPGDEATITVDVHPGATDSTAPVQTLTAQRAGGIWSVSGTSPLTDGVYTVRAIQRDSAGNATVSDPVTFTVDTAPPETNVVAGPSGPTRDSTPELSFSSADGRGFVCRVYRDGDPPPTFAACTSPDVTQPLGDGAYVFEVAAIDAAGNQDPSPAKREFRVDTTAPHTNITVGPGDTTAADAAFTFTADEAATFSCRLDGAAWEPCTSPRVYSGLAPGPHTFEVRGVDAAGNAEVAAASSSWQVLRPGLKVPAVGSQAVALAGEVVQMRRTLRHTPLRRLAKRGKLTFPEFDAITPGIIDLRVTAGRATFAAARWELPDAGRYTIDVKLTRRGRRLARTRPRLAIALAIAFTDRAGRTLHATASATMRRLGTR
jgi:Bacterial Ig-like domain